MAPYRELAQQAVSGALAVRRLSECDGNCADQERNDRGVRGVAIKLEARTHQSLIWGRTRPVLRLRSPSAPIALSLPGMVQSEDRSLPPRQGTGPRLALEAVHKGPPRVASAVLHDAPASKTSKRVRDGIWVANIFQASQWPVSNVDQRAITLNSVADTGQVTDISHSTFSVGTLSGTVTFDYWRSPRVGIATCSATPATPGPRPPMRRRSSLRQPVARSRNLLPDKPSCL
jgi:hypothetical protein